MASFDRRQLVLAASPLNLILLAVFFTGCAFILSTPPFEGFDETAHYSSVQLIADEGRIPVYGKDLIARDVNEYLTVGPDRYSSVPPFDESPNKSYKDVFMDEGGVDAMRSFINQPPKTPRKFEQGRSINWQAQHPPLSYIALAPVYSLTKTLDWKAHLFWLRLACWVVAFAGLWIGVEATASFFKLDQATLGPSSTFSDFDQTENQLAVPFMMACWPFLAPMFFVEMARLGNDSFCLLFAGISWAALLNYLKHRSTQSGVSRASFLLASAIGFGALTKAFFLPVAVGIGLLLSWHAISDLLRDIRGTSHQSFLQQLARVLAPVAVFGVTFLIIAGGWYAQKYFSTGTITGSHDMASLKASGGMSAADSGFSIFIFLNRLASLYMSFVWAGTWSFVSMPRVLEAILSVLFAIPLVYYLQRVVRERPDKEIFTPGLLDAPIFMVAPVVVGLGYHAAVQVMLGPKGIVTPGYYLHIFATPIGFAFALGAIRLMELRTGIFAVGRLLIVIFVLYAALFIVLAQFHQMTLFSGCSIKDPITRTYRALECFGHAPLMMERLEILIFPKLALTFYALGGGLFILAAWRAIKKSVE
ncbi:MAG: hypothetical protein AAF720_03520 [Pseudomonadota bacterium]